MVASRSAKKVTLSTTSKDGGKLELSYGSAAEADAVMEAARKFLER